MALMQVTLHGDVASATYRFVSLDGATLAESGLTRFPSVIESSRFAAAVRVPEQRFRIDVGAVGANGTALSWRSSTYTPADAALNVVPTTTLAPKGATVPLILRLASVAATGDYAVRLWLPSGFSGASGPFMVSLVPGQTTEISLSVALPSTGPTFTRYTVSAEAIPTTAGAVTLVANLAFLVE